MTGLFRCVALSGVLLSAPCWASDATSTDNATGRQSNKALALVHFERGIQEFRSRRYKEAIDAFLLANDLYPSSAISFNIARAYESLEDASGALRFYRDYLRREPSALDAAPTSKRIEELEDRLRQLGVQQVTILSNPSGAALSVDGRAVGATPWTGDVLPGNHGVELSHRGYVNLLGVFELSSHRAAEHTFALEALASAMEPASSAGAMAPSSRARAEPLPAPAPLEHRSTATVMTYLPWVSLGAGALAFGGAGYFEMKSSTAESRARRAPTQAGALTHIHDMQSAQLTARILLGVGGALAATGGLLLWWDTGSPKEPANLALGCGAGSCALRGAF